MRENSVDHFEWNVPRQFKNPIDFHDDTWLFLDGLYGHVPIEPKSKGIETSELVYFVSYYYVLSSRMDLICIAIKRVQRVQCIINTKSLFSVCPAPNICIRPNNKQIYIFLFYTVLFSFWKHYVGPFKKKTPFLSRISAILYWPSFDHFQYCNIGEYLKFVLV